MFIAGTDKIRYFQKLLLSETNNLDAAVKRIYQMKHNQQEVSQLSSHRDIYSDLQISTVIREVKNERNSDSWQYESDIHVEISWNIYGANNQRKVMDCSPGGHLFHFRNEQACGVYWVFMLVF